MTDSALEQSRHGKFHLLIDFLLNRLLIEEVVLFVKYILVMSKTRCRYDIDDIDKQDTISYRYRLMIRISFLSFLIVSISSHVIPFCVDIDDIVWISTHNRFSHPCFIFMSISSISTISYRYRIIICFLTCGSFFFHYRRYRIDIKSWSVFSHVITSCVVIDDIVSISSHDRFSHPCFIFMSISSISTISYRYRLIIDFLTCHSFLCRYRLVIGFLSYQW
jgi:hypothetical protein